MSPAHLRDITRSVIDKQYLDNRVYRNSSKPHIKECAGLFVYWNF